MIHHVYHFAIPKFPILPILTHLRYYPYNITAPQILATTGLAENFYKKENITDVGTILATINYTRGAF